MEYIEENLTRPIRYESLSRIVGCSVYEFSRIFSFMAGMSISEYIRRRRLSQAVFDIQNSNEKIIDIALKYCYESPTAFTRAFKEVQGVAPTQAQKMNVPLKIYPPITFALTIKGGNAMNFRIEEKESFKIIGLFGYETAECNAGDTLTPLWREFMDKYNSLLWNGGGADNHYIAPFWQVAAYDFQSDNGKTKAIIGAEYTGKNIENMTVETIPAATWVVFSITSSTGINHVPAAYAQILTEWFPVSQFKRDETVPNLEVFPEGDVNASDYTWEIWIPVVKKLLLIKCERVYV